MVNLDLSGAGEVRFGNSPALAVRIAGVDVWEAEGGAVDPPIDLTVPQMEVGWEENTGTTTTSTGEITELFEVSEEGASVWGDGKHGTGSGPSEWTGPQHHGTLTNWTGMLWYRLDAPMVDEQRIRLFGARGTFDLNLWATQGLKAIEYTGGEAYAVTFEHNVSSTFAHLAFVANATDAKTYIYLNGVLTKTFNKASIFQDLTLVGSTNASGLHVDDFRTFNTALSAQEIQAWMDIPA